MFEHPLIQIHKFEDIPLNRDIYLMGEEWMAEFAAAMVLSLDGDGESAYSVGYASYAAARAIGADSVELSWYPNIFDRFHQVEIVLPRSAFVACVESWQGDYKPCLFVRDEWLNNLYFRSHSIFALVDAIGVKAGLASGVLTRSSLIELRNRIDEIAADNPPVAFISFADSLLLKSNYTVGVHDREVKYTYEPERILRLLPDIQTVYQSVLGMGIYAVITQGNNEYSGDGLLHISDTQNHISLNSLGLPFAQTQAIEHQVRKSIRLGIHPAADAYLDETFYHSLRFRMTFEKSTISRFPYTAPMATGPSSYFPISFQSLADNLEPTRSELHNRSA